MTSLSGTLLPGGAQLTLPFEWLASDLGTPDHMEPPSQGIAASQTSIDLSAGGFKLNDEPSLDDDLLFVYQPIAGDFDARVRISSMDSLEYYAIAGLMFRESIIPTTNYAHVVAYNPLGLNQYRSYGRLSPNGWFEVPRSKYTPEGVGPDRWLRLVREFGQFTYLVSPDGTNWTVDGEWSQTLATNGLVGITASAQNFGRSNSVNASFRDFRVTAPRPMVWVESSVANDTLLESGGRVARLRVRSSGVMQTDLHVKVKLGGTATPGIDYAMPPSEVIIPAGYSDASIDIKPLDDLEIEGPETVVVSLAADSAYEVVQLPITLTILDDENPVGGLLERFFYDVGYFYLTNLTTNPNFPGRPNSIGALGSLERGVPVLHYLRSQCGTSTVYERVRGTVNFDCL